MKVLPAIDLRDGACVQLVGGKFDQEKVRKPDPLAVSRNFAQAGLTEQHVVDLDAALGKGSNANVVAALAAQPGIVLQVGGGIRTDEDVTRLFDLGAARVIVGTRAVGDFDWLTRIAEKYPSKIIVAADVRGRAILTRGWTHTAEELTIDLFLGKIAPLPLAGALVTAVHVEGQMRGPDLDLIREVVSTKIPIFASGGVGSLDQIRAVAEAGAHRLVVGMALYVGRIDLNLLGQEFSK